MRLCQHVHSALRSSTRYKKLFPGPDPATPIPLPINVDFTWLRMARWGHHTEQNSNESTKKCIFLPVKGTAVWCQLLRKTIPLFSLVQFNPRWLLHCDDPVVYVSTEQLKVFWHLKNTPRVFVLFAAASRTLSLQLSTTKCFKKQTSKCPKKVTLDKQRSFLVSFLGTKSTTDLYFRKAFVKPERFYLGLQSGVSAQAKTVLCAHNRRYPMSHLWHDPAQSTSPGNSRVTHLREHISLTLPGYICSPLSAAPPWGTQPCRPLPHQGNTWGGWGVFLHYPLEA